MGHCLPRFMIGGWREAVRFVGVRRHLFSDIGFVSAVVLLIVGSILCWVAYDEYWEAQAAEYRLLEAHARNADAQVAQALGKIERVLKRIADERLKDPGRRGKAFIGVLDRHREDVPEIGTLLVTDAAGRIHTATNAALLGRDVAAEAYFTAHRRPGQTPTLFMARPDQRLLGATTVVFSLPIVDADGRFLGIAGIAIGYWFFPSVLQAIHPDDSASMTVIYNRDGDMLFRRLDPEKWFGFNMVKASTVYGPHLSAGKPVTRHIGSSAINGKTRLFLVRDVGDSGLSLILSRQLDEVLANWQHSVVSYALIFAFTAAVVSSLAVVAGRRKREVLAGKAFADQLIETANVMVVGLDAAGRITIFNETAERISGYCRHEVLGCSWSGLAVPPEASPGVREIFDRFRQAGTLPHTAEYPLLTKGGQERVISWQNSVIEEPRAAISFGIDVTERKRMEDDVAAARLRAEDANRAKSQFLAAVSHDLRQPIHAQGLFLGALARTELSAHQRDVLANATAASKASGEMLTTLLDFSRLEAGVVAPRVQAFSLQPLLNKIEREFESLADAKGIAYRSRETDLAGRSDPLLVELILRNLVSNAIRYTGRGGVLVACRQRGTDVVLEVWDTGIGIAAESQQAVFREFLQLANPQQDSQNGLGLGLAIADGLARTLGHRLSLASVPQRGSVFRLALPMTAEVPPVETPAPLQMRWRTLEARVLVLDDDERVRTGMLGLLADWGCECEAAASIEEALELARTRMPDLIVSDYRLRERLTGIDAIAALRALAGRAVPAVLITGDTAPDRLREAGASGIQLLHKPVSPRQLYRELSTLLRQT